MLDPTLWDETMRINLTAPFLVCRAALEYLRSSERASIVNVASGVGLLPFRGSGVAYSSSKAGLIGLTRALAAELAPTVRVNAVCPGLTSTPLVAELLEHQRNNCGSSLVIPGCVGRDSF